MANLREEPKWESGIYQLEITDPVQGGVDGIDNVQARQLANRTLFLKKQQESLKEQQESNIGKTSVEVNRNSRGAGIGYAFGKERFLTYDFGNEKHRGLKIKAGTHLRLDIVDSGAKTSRWLDVEEDRFFDIDADITAAARATSTRANEANGRNFYVYLAPDGEKDVKLVVSCNSTFPNDIDSMYNANNTRKIGQFHTLCVNVSASLKANIAEAPSCGLTPSDKVLVKQYGDDDEDGFHDFYNTSVVSVTKGSYYDVVKVQHPLAGFTAGQILPESVFCLSFRPKSNPDGMVYDIDTDMIFDIYIQSGLGSETASEYNATVTNSRAHPNHQNDMRHKKKRLLYDHEFSSAAAGSNERTAIKGAANPGRVGGHVDSNDDRMISFIGCEDCCGVWWQWLENTSAAGLSTAWGNTNSVGSGGYTDGRIDFTNTWYSMDGQDAFGAMHACNTALLAGGYWSDSSFCGSRSRHADDARSHVPSSFAGRGASHLLHG